MERQVEKLVPALIKAQAAYPKWVKDSDNPFFKSKYASLPTLMEAIRKPLADNGLVMTSLCEPDEGTLTICTLLMHESGQILESRISFNTSTANAQQIGSFITYGVRYTSWALAWIPADDDDDGNAASKPTAEPAKKTEPDNPYLKARAWVEERHYNANLVDVLCAVHAYNKVPLKALEDKAMGAIIQRFVKEGQNLYKYLNTLLAEMTPNKRGIVEGRLDAAGIIFTPDLPNIYDNIADFGEAWHAKETQ